MIIGTGVDIVENARFKRWTTYSNEQLEKMYTSQELLDCKNKDGKFILEKLATRFAAKEAFFKALSSSLVKYKKTEKKFSFIAIAPLVGVQVATWNVPQLSVDWSALKEKVGVNLSSLQLDLSLSHEKSHSIAFVVISKK